MVINLIIIYNILIHWIDSVFIYLLNVAINYAAHIITI